MDIDREICKTSDCPILIKQKAKISVVTELVHFLIAIQSIISRSLANNENVVGHVVKTGKIQPEKLSSVVLSETVPT